jgi:ABC-type antimicrobial peptide transport system permease subunit
MDATAIVDGITTMEAVVARAQAPWRLTMWMFVLFAVLAFGLAALGLFSLVALDVAQRRREFAIRLALGASRSSIVSGVLRRAGGRVLLGCALGALAAVSASRAMERLLFEIAPRDAITYAAVFGLVAIVVVTAAYLPARKAGDAEPQALLRES